MKKIKSTHKLLFAICLTLSLQGCGKTSNAPFTPSNSSDQSAQGPEVFSEATEDSQLEQTEEVHGTRIHQRRIAKINIAALRKALEGNSGSLTLNLFKNKKFSIQVDSITKNSDSNYVATGHIKGEVDSSVTLVLNDNVLVLTVKSSTDDQTYEAHYDGKSGGHEITEQTEVEDTEDSCATVEAPQDGEDPIIDENQGDSVLEVPTIRMLVVYTPNARIKVGGASAMQALIQLGVADANTAFSNSGTNLQVQLAGTLETNSNESSSYSNDLNSLRSSTDSKWNEIHAARTKYSADQVTLIGAYTNVSNPVGIGFYKASKSYAFTIVKYSVISTMFTLAHELGHNIGLAHEDGYVNSIGKFRTIMAYGTYKRIRRYSNPNISYNGLKTGTSAQYSAKIINSNSVRMAGLIP